MCSMCHYCGAKLMKYNEDQRKQNSNALISSSGDPVWSCKLCWERQGREFVNREGISPFATPMISPTTSLSSSDQSNSGCSDFSVDINSYDCGEGEQDVGSNNSHGELNCLPNGRLQHLSSESPRKRVDSSNMMTESNLRDKKNTNDMDIVRDVEITEASNEQEAKENVVENSPRTINKESGVSQSINVEMDTQIWEPPEPEDPEDDLEGAMAYDDDDDDDECGDGTKWGKPSSLSRTKDEGNGSHRFKEEKQRAMKEVINGKVKAIVSQLLKSVGVACSMNEGDSWVDIVTSLSWEAALFLKPDAIDGKAMGPDGYVKVKCIATGSHSQSQLIKGLVFKKHAAHKHMQTKYKNPRLLLIQGVLGQSSSGLSSFSSLDEEKVHLKSLSEMIDMYHPNVILVEKTVSRGVQEFILAKGITLVFDMKLHRLERVARCTGLPIIPSDTLMNQKLKLNDSFKQCDSFHIEKFAEEHACFGEGGKRPSKTLMFLEGCPKRLGCTILLKGSHSEELKKIKCVVQYAVVIAYHLILETSFLIDQKTMFSTIPFTGIADMLPIDRESHALEIGNVSVPCLDESTAETGSHEIDIPISTGFQEEGYHINGEINGDQIAESGLDYSSAFSLEPYNPAIFSGLSSISASLKKVIGNNFPLASTAPYRLLSAYFGLNGRESKLTEAVPTMKSFEVSEQFDVESKSGPEEEKSLDDAQPQSFLVSIEVPLNLKVNGNHNEEKMQKKEDINTMLDSQSILVLMSSRNSSRGTICEQSHFSHIMFYKNFDVPLGKFLQDNLLNQKSRCAICGELPEAHFYYYAHHNKQLTIQVKRLPKHLPGKAEGKLWMWSRCSKCKTGNGISKSTKRVLISTAAHSLSFGKFLELSFSDCSSSSRSSSCGHSHHRDFLYFFGLGPMVAMFSYSSVTTYTVSVPTQQLEFSKSIRQDWLKEEFENVHKKGMLMFREVASFLVQIRSQFVGSTLNLRDSLKEFFDVEEMLKQEASEFEVNIQNAVAKNGNANMGFHELLILNQLRWDLLLESCIWDRRLHSLLLPDPTVVIAGASNKAVLEQLISDMGSADGEDSGTETKYGNGDKGSDNSGKLKAGTSSFVERKEFSGDEFSSNIPVQKSEGCDSIHGNSAVAENIEKPKVDGVCPVKSSNLEFVVTPHISVRPHFDEKNYQAEDASLSDHLQVDRTIPISTDLAFNDSIVDSNGSRRGGSPRSLLSSLENLNGWFWMPFSEIRQMYMKDLLRGNVPKFESFSSCTPAQIPTGYQLIREEGSRLHIPLGTNDYIVSDYEGELSSIIACALVLLKDLPSVTEVSNEDGKRDRLIESLHSLTRVPMIASVHWSSSGSSDSDSVSSLSISSEESRFSSFDGLNLLDSRVPPDSLNIEVSLGLSKSLGKGKYSVVSLYANQFRDLRERCCPSELDYIASLSRCRKWDAKGGKSKSFFAKTLDDRFIIKEIKKTEYDSFEKFALHYFKYMNQSFETGSQTCLAKVLGIYQVIVRQPKTGKESRHDLKVMENLTFGRNITRQYDLKGALHARFSSGADGSGDVLLDQNFVNDMNSSPLYVSNKAKRILQRAVWNDTTFLNSINVMDYSLLVGVDTQRRELVCGIIDYLRQYTWDKQLETWVKSSLVVPKNVLPTVISPKEYKKRFRKFMSTYFLSVPDHWCSEESSDPSELCSIGDYDLSQSKSLKQPYLNDFPA
ncbi:putative 1-phosphatidylinositol-3-phosphate 5-kinase FAB1D isoform X1 [Durio zibethinus]|uniref:1-phosphatidylinositol-3-phosphate 5-kinase n=1 Tax=Durio zibethinus TaxID=66656 RepID=A0A6P5WR78_DURZI|nr:putative 1-phosphatidylinositol-3-phosphate 5-kinase FAB1D isoform X1 [Durio zibethinus]XP_022718207.1 putative 1-phosphatidylinositol-3-phosphate 5-kinase FAB1D isoform X1 [Durio zibethinus]